MPNGLSRARRRERPAARAEGRLHGVVLPARAQVGDLIPLEVAGRKTLALVERADVAAWDLGEPAGEDLDQIFARRVTAAIERRRRVLPPDLTVYRAVHDAGDALPGIAVDVYGAVAICQCYGRAFRRHADSLARALRAYFGAVRVVERGPRGRSGSLDRWYGDPIREQIVNELGLRFRVRFDENKLGSGLYADQRPQRCELRARAAGQRTLNLFGYAGGFTVAAAVGGALQVDHVDSSRSCLRWASDNLALNDLDPRRHRFIEEDARAFARRARRRGERYGIVVVDPPTFALGATPFRVARDLGPLLADCCALLADRGLLLVSSNARGLNWQRLAAIARDAARASGRPAAITAATGQGDDYPYLDPAGALHHLKALWLRMVEG
ncbi:MAG: class I SAM-dependent rRNA methyltransferase [Deltaproteobacteria bacterium]|nr:class I SAM-dependent rRNA methyltransferase [Deltaproteobacteria bacterium]